MNFHASIHGVRDELGSPEQSTSDVFSMFVSNWFQICSLEYVWDSNILLIRFN
jgi:hypothetical protein